MKIRNWIVALQIFSICLSAQATLPQKLEKLLSSHGKKVSFSLRDTDGKEVSSFNGDLALSPASIAKAVTTACSLDVLGPQFQYETLFSASGQIEGDSLKGDLVIQGSGDPSIVIEDLREIVEKLRFVHGIKKITGDLIFDLSYFGKRALPTAEGFEGDSGRSFTADLTPISFNQNSFSIWVTPDLRDSKKTRAVSLPAQVVDVEISNRSKIASSTEVSVSYDPKKMEATVAGGMTKDAEPKGIYRAVGDSYEYAFKLFRRLWLDAGGEWPKGEAKYSNTPVKATLLWKHGSNPLSKILNDVNKLSLNLGAEMIFLAAGGSKFDRPANYDKSLNLLKECLSGYKIPEGSIVLNNGSGLSRQARIKTSGLSLFLQKYAQTPYAPEYLSSFGILGVDGTTKARLKNFAGRARLKTGSLKDVRSIAGYLYSADKKAYSFAMIQNSVDPNDAKQLEDEVIKTILQEL
jgi:serine-type D-Ala-D-Ala carboxypeptidase/endopeptidase (penicillin-binding protein 4)